MARARAWLLAHQKNSLTKGLAVKKRYLIWILWPSFLAAVIVSGIIFAVVDPIDIKFMGYISISRMTTYALGFFLFWFMAAISSAYTLKLSPKGQVVDDFGEPIK